MDNGNSPPTNYLINNRYCKSTSDKVDIIITALEDIVSTFKARGCPEGKELLRETLRRHHFGDSPWSIK